MSYSRRFSNSESRRAFDDPFFSNFDPYSIVPRQQQQSGDRNRSGAAQPYGGNSMTDYSGEGGLTTRIPNVHLSDEGEYYIVEAEVPGIRRENLDVSVGDNGRSLTIRGGAAVSGSAVGDSVEETEGASPSVGKSARGTTSTTEYTETVTTSSSRGGESQPVQRWTSRSSFARTIWLPRPVDPQRVQARLDHGVLTMEIPKLSAQNHRITIG